MISQFPTEIQRAAVDFKTLQVTNYAFSLAKAFNDFYNKCPVIQEETAIKEFRLHLVDSSRQVIANSLKLLGIQAPSIM
ncbi:MAG: hypothetical protein GWN30_27215 [Gammaproteobacteria bacterium]|nr:hypothetical protein [Gammaproteobacteria bacterium]